MDSRAKIGVIGFGYVGRATRLALNADVVVYDTDPALCIPIGTTMKDLKNCSLIFVCVPTPMKPDGTCHTKIVEEVVHSLTAMCIDPLCIFIRSTVPCGTCERLGVNFMPEFLTEKNWKEDVKNCSHYMIGVDGKYNVAVLRDAVPKSKEIHIFTTKEVELIKYVRNVFLATKVAFFNEIADFCHSTDINYDHVREGVGADPRIGMSHTAVPGPDGKRGFGGTCFPKDIKSLYHQMFDQGHDPSIIDAVILRNKIDRPEEDWKEDEGRAYIDEAE